MRSEPIKSSFHTQKVDTQTDRQTDRLHSTPIGRGNAINCQTQLINEKETTQTSLRMIYIYIYILLWAPFSISHI